jgi:exonuclease SbcC
MIPIRLKLSNFMPYRENVPALSFTGIHTASICGDNGSGKSSLIDAMTWALWGKARAHSDDDLIHQNANQTQVEFDFIVDNQVYRVVRRHARAKSRRASGPSELQLFISNDGVFKPITGDRMTDTGKKIVDILHMDYDTFINSAYLRQGHADQFTVAIASKRKDVLASILGLSIYDELEAKAKEKAKFFESDILQLAAAINEYTTELARKPEYEAELEKAQSTLAEIEALAQVKDTALAALRQKKEALDTRKNRLDELEVHLAGTARDLRLWEEQAVQHLAHVKQYEVVIGRRDEIETGYSQYTKAKTANDELERKFRQSVVLEKQKAQLESRIDKARNALTSEHTIIAREIERLDTLLKTLPGLKNQLNEAEERIHKLEEAELVIRQQEASAKDLHTRVNLLEGEISRLESELKKTGEKIDLITGHIAAHTDAKCPLCESELTREGLELILGKYTGERDDRTALLKQDRENLERLKKKYEAAQKEKSRLETGYNQEKAAAYSQRGALNKQVAEIEEEGKKLAPHHEALDDIEQKLAKRDFAVNEQQTVIAIDNELASLGYDPEKHEYIRSRLKGLESFERDKLSLEEAVRLIDREREGAARAQSEAGVKRDNLKRDNEEKEALSAQLAGLPALVQELASAESEYRNISARRNQAQETLGSARNQLNRLAVLEEKKTEKEDAIARATKEAAIFRELAEAFGKNGVQALLIERALPEIEAEANKLLGRMTDNRMHVRFQTQRPKKDGGMIETLDINIADELGTRNYEMFSGGEAFRINFAIRIALSKVLARRAGARLPTLIIDEGFGTQDATGMEKLKEAITSIQDDFEKILVVTHIEDFRDAFPTRIDVIKTAEGSTIEVN